MIEDHNPSLVYVSYIRPTMKFLVPDIGDALSRLELGAWGLEGGLEVRKGDNSEEVQEKDCRTELSSRSSKMSEAPTGLEYGPRATEIRPHSQGHDVDSATGP